MNVFFTADTHFSHANIIKYCKRPFNSVTEMDNKLVDNWNAKVGPDDLVYHLGDFCFNPKPEQYFYRLNGKIRLIRGNHDRDTDNAYDSVIKLGLEEKYLSIEDVRCVRIEGQEIWLSHYAHRVWPKSHRGTWHLYGHSHGTLPDDPNALSFDCGVDCHNFSPLSFNEVKAIMSKKTFKAVDHHGSK